ncbi:serine/threonine-protein kinase Sgk2 [Xylaria telfairii]|nr:serine/threonine-protein kinase Sgk2 [Xylaria telfairii]
MATMELSKDQIAIIAANPLPVLDPARHELRQNTNIRIVLVRDVIPQLARSSAMWQLRAPLNDPIDDLRQLANAIFGRNGYQYNPNHYSRLIDAIRSGSPDTEIVVAYLDLLQVTQNPTTPPTTFPSSYFESSRLDESALDEIHSKIFSEIQHCVFRNVGGFRKKYFDPDSWPPQQKEMYTRMMSQHNNNGWGFPQEPDKRHVWNWLVGLEALYLTSATNKLRRIKTDHHNAGTKGQMDVYFGSADPASKDVLVVGELKKSADSGRFKADICQLARLVRSNFYHQPTRRFVHAFLLCGSEMELWVFDRSGLYSSNVFNIVQYPRDFASAFVRYATMDSNALGQDIFIQRSHKVTLQDANNTAPHVTMTLAAQPFVKRNAIASRGTTCYKAENDQYVAKFTWAPQAHTSELQLLKLAKERNVRGVATVVAYQEITSVANLREQLKFGPRHQFKKITEDNPSGKNMSGHKRKCSSKGSSGVPTKRPRVSDGQLNSAHSASSHRSLEPIEETALDNQATDGTDSPCESLTKDDKRSWGNRIYSCVVVAPPGRVISEFTSIKELLESMADAIRAHQCLYKDGKILHRDISPNNIIITNPNAASAHGFKGMLIDLDMAKQEDQEQAGAPERTGTLQFMAIEVLRGKNHTYRHDLESFFYVLIWMCARQSWKNGFAAAKEWPRQPSDLQKWENGNYHDNAQNKESAMGLDIRVKELMDEFPRALAAVKPLCKAINLTLFGSVSRKVNIGTPTGDPDQLYAPILKAYDEVIRDL